MSVVEKKFLSWFGGIAAALIIASVIGLFRMSENSAVYREQIQNNQQELQYLKQYHKDDVALIRKTTDEIKEDQKEIKSDIKEILKELK